MKTYILEATHVVLGLQRTGLPQLTLATVQVEALGLQDLPLADNGPHLAVEELLERVDEALGRARYELALRRPELLFVLAHFEQDAP